MPAMVDAKEGEERQGFEDDEEVPLD